MNLLPHHGRFRYRAIADRPAYRWPGGRRLAVYLGFNLEHFAFGEGLGARLAPSGEPDVLNYAWREYGNRVGAWRCIELFDALQLPVGVLLNTSLYDHCPELVAALRPGRYRWGSEMIGHGHTNAERQSDLSPERELALIRRCTERMHAQEGRAPRGWLSPWIAETRGTPDLLSQCGYAYTLNWCHDDQPLPMATARGPIWSVPYPQEVNDIPMIVARQMSGSDFADLIVDTFDEMLEQSEHQPLVMGIALHPYLVGQPARLRHLRRALSHLVRSERAWWCTPGAIVDHLDGLPEIAALAP